jgi:molybdopterin biosynthesis enzyme
MIGSTRTTRFERTEIKRVDKHVNYTIMVEHTETRDDDDATVIEVRRAAAAGQFIAFASSDLARGETVLRAGHVLTSREIGMLAAVGCAAVEVWRRPRVAIISTGDEIVAPGEAIRPGAVYDSNTAILAAAVEEAGGSANRTRRRDSVVAPCRRRACHMRHGDSFGRHFEGRRRSLLPRHLLVK